MLGLGALLQIGLLVVLPHLAGLAVTRFVRRASWTAWPAAAIATFGLVFHWWLWVPVRDAADPRRCGLDVLALGFVLVTGLVGHLGVGVLCGRLARRRR